MVRMDYWVYRYAKGRSAMNSVPSFVADVLSFSRNQVALKAARGDV